MLRLLFINCFAREESFEESELSSFFCIVNPVGSPCGLFLQTENKVRLSPLGQKINGIAGLEPLHPIQNKGEVVILELNDLNILAWESWDHVDVTSLAVSLDDQDFFL